MVVAICLRRFETFEWKPFHIFHRWNICCQSFVSFESHTIFQYTAKRGYKQRLSSETQGMSQEKQIIINMIFAILKVVCILYVRFGTVLSHVVLQLLWLFARVVALLAGKRFLAGVWKHVILQTTGATGREAALITYKWLFCSVGELVALENTSSSAWIVALVTPEWLLSWMRQHVANLFSYLETFFKVCLMNLPFMSLTEMVSSLIWRSRRMTSGCRSSMEAESRSALVTENKCPKIGGSKCPE